MVKFLRNILFFGLLCMTAQTVFAAAAADPMHEAQETFGRAIQLAGLASVALKPGPVKGQEGVSLHYNLDNVEVVNAIKSGASGTHVDDCFNKERNGFQGVILDDVDEKCVVASMCGTKNALHGLLDAVLIMDTWPHDSFFKLTVRCLGEKTIVDAARVYAPNATGALSDEWLIWAIEKLYDTGTSKATGVVAGAVAGLWSGDEAKEDAAAGTPPIGWLGMIGNAAWSACCAGVEGAIDAVPEIAALKKIWDHGDPTELSGILRERFSAALEEANELVAEAHAKAAAEGKFLLVTGHSLGGALATIATAQQHAAGKITVPFQVKGFCLPSVVHTLNELKVPMPKAFTDNVFNLIRAGDPVSQSGVHLGKTTTFAYVSDETRLASRMHKMAVAAAEAAVSETADAADTKEALAYGTGLASLGKNHSLDLLMMDLMNRTGKIVKA